MTDTRSARSQPFEPDTDAEIDALDTDDEGEDNDNDEADRVAKDAPPAEEESSKEKAAPSEPESAQRDPGYQTDPAALQTAQTESAKIDAALDQLAEQYEAGDLDFKEYRKQERALISQQQSLRLEEVKAQVYQDMSRQQAAREWNGAVEAFRANPANRAFESPTMLPMMKGQLDAIWQEPDTADKPYSWALEEAKRRVQATLRDVLGMTAPVESEAGKPGGGKKPALTTATLPKTLGSLPAARANATGGEFSALDSLNGLALEDALSRMKPEQRERWLDS